MHPRDFILASLGGGLIVSCQALPGEPLHRPGAEIMALMADAAFRAGAVGIRTNGAEDIVSIKRRVDLPVIGLVKRRYEPFEPYITVTMAEVDEVVSAGADVVAVELTDRPRPDGRSVAEWVAEIRRRHPARLLMADIATYAEGMAAAAAGVDLVGTTMSGHTPRSQGSPTPDLPLVSRLAADITVPVVAEGGIHAPEQARAALDAGAHCVVVGGAITRPQEIATRFVAALT